MSEPVLANAQWQYDYIPEYRLDETIISKYLKEIWGNYKYFVMVSQVVRDRKTRMSQDDQLPHSAQAMISGSGYHASSKR